MSARARRSGLARTQIGPVWRNPGHAPFGAPSPSCRGKEKEGDDGQTPAPDPSPGRADYCLALSVVVPAKRALSAFTRVFDALWRARAGTRTPKTIDGTRSMGPSFRHAKAWTTIERPEAPGSRFRGDERMENAHGTNENAGSRHSPHHSPPLRFTVA